MIAIIAATLLAFGHEDGPISKFNNNRPDFEGHSAVQMYDIERCLIDLDGKLGAPTVYRQPDRPDRETLLWGDKSRTLRRIDLRKDGDGTYVTAWHPRDDAAKCAGLAAD